MPGLKLFGKYIVNIVIVAGIYYQHCHCAKNIYYQHCHCARAPGADACYGDSGGPFTMQEENRAVLIGVRERELYFQV